MGYKIFWCWIFKYKVPLKQWMNNINTVCDSGTCSWVLLLSWSSLQKFVTLEATYYSYCILTKECSWASTLQVSQRMGKVLLQVFHFNHEWVLVSCLQWLNALKANNWTKKFVQRSHKWLWSQVLMAHNILNGTMSPWTWCSWWSMLH